MRPSSFDRLLGLRKTWCRFWGATRAAPPRLDVVAVGVFLHTGERLFSRHQGLFGSPLFDSHWSRDSLDEFRLHMEYKHGHDRLCWLSQKQVEQRSSMKRFGDQQNRVRGSNEMHAYGIGN
jgi:hypothetical protein